MRLVELLYHYKLQDLNTSHMWSGSSEMYSYTGSNSVRGLGHVTGTWDEARAESARSSSWFIVHLAPCTRSPPALFSLRSSIRARDSLKLLNMVSPDPYVVCGVENSDENPSSQISHVSHGRLPEFLVGR
jgi:hypothetical protein